jgi:subtilisin family serine protease
MKDQNGKFELLVKLTDMNLDFESFKQALQSATSEAQLKIKKLDSSRVLVEFAKDSPAKAVVEKFIEQRKIAHIEADQKTFAFDTNESAAADMETATAAPVSTATATGTGKDVVVAIIDSGVDYTHKDLAPYMWHNPGEIPDNGIDDDHNGFIDDVYGWDFVNDDKDPQADDTKYHGTHVAGIVKQAALLAGSGVNFKIMALKYLDSTASGRTSNAIRAIDYAIKNGAIIMNNSWGSTGTSQALTDAIERARQANVLFMAAAGNGDSNGVGINIDQNLFYPAADPHDNVISVAAADDSGVLAGWSNYGLKNVDLAAPGVNILSTRNGNNYVRMSGTSMATPYVSGVAAMLWSQRPDLAYDEIRKILFSSTKPGASESGKMVTGGMINWSAAVQAATNYAHDPSDKGTPALTPSECAAP